MAEELIDQYVDRSAVSDDTKFLTDQLKTVLELLDKVNATKVTLKGAKSMSEMVQGAQAAQEQVEKLGKAKTKLLTIDMAAAKENKRLNEELIKSGVKLAATDTQVAKAVAIQKDEIRKRNAELKNQIREEGATKGSIEQRRVALIRLQKEYDNLSPKERESSRGQRLEKSVAGLTNQLKQLEGATGRFQRNVGNYEGSAKIIVDAFERAQKKVAQVTSRFGDVSPEARAARQELEGLQRIVEDPKFLKISAKFGDSNQELRFFQKQLVELERAGLGSSEAANELRKSLAKLTDDIADTRAEVKALSSDTRAFDLFASSVSFLADTFQVAAGAAVAMGASEEDAAEATKNLLAIQNIANGVKGIANELTTRGTAANKAYAFIQAQVAIATDSTAAATARLRAAFITLGIGAIIVAIGYLVANFGKIKEALSGVSKDQKRYNDLLKEASSQYAEAVKQVNELKINIDLAKKGFISKSEVLKQYNEGVGKTIGQVVSLDEAEKKLAAGGDAYIKMMLFKAAANLALEEAAKKAFEAEQIRRKKEQEFITFSDRAIATPIPEPGKKAPDQADFQKKFIEEQGKKRREAAVKEAQKDENAFKDIALKFQQQAAEISKQFKFDFFGDNNSNQKTRSDLQAQLEILKINLQARIDNNKKISEAEGIGLLTRLEARRKVFEDEKKIIIAEQAFALTEEDITAKEKTAIIIKANDDIRRQQELLAIDLLSVTQNFRSRQKELLEQDIALAAELPQDKTTDELLDKEDKLFEKRKAHLEESRDILLSSIERERNAKIKSSSGDAERQRIEEFYNNKRAKVEMDTNADILISALEVAEAKLKLVQDPAAKAGIEGQIADLKKQLEELRGVEIDFKIEGATQKLEKLKNKIQEIGEKLIEAFSAVGDILGANIDREKNAIQDQMDALDKKKEKDIEVANSQAGTEEEKAARITTINARAAAQKETLERRQRQLDQQRARFDKAKNIAEAILRAAIATIEGLIKGGPILAAVYGAIGAAQVAAAIAAPIPKFKGGRTGGKATLGITGDGGKHEVLTSPDLKQAVVTPDTDTLTYIPENWKVFPDIKSFTETAARMSMKPVAPVEHRAFNEQRLAAMLMAGYGRYFGSLEKTIEDKQETYMFWNNGEMQKAIKKGNDWWRYKQNNIH